MKKIAVFFVVVLGLLALLPILSTKAVILSDGDLIRGPDRIKVYVVNKYGYKRHIFNPDVFNMYGHLKWSSIKEVDQKTLDSYKTSDLYRVAGDYKVFFVTEDGKKCHLNMTPKEFIASGYSWDQIFIINEKEGNYYDFGPEVEKKEELNSIIGGVLESDQVNAILFSPAISALVNFDKNEYEKNLDELEATITKKNISDVIIKGDREIVSPYRPIYLFDLNDMRWALANVDKVKESGIDTLMLQIPFLADKDRNPVVMGEEIYLFYINAFHKSRFRIWMLLGPQQYYCNSEGYTDHDSRLKYDDEFFAVYEPQIYRWAEIAEKYNIDAFIPADEAQRLFIEDEVLDRIKARKSMAVSLEDYPKISNWVQKILPEIKKRFHGYVGFETESDGPLELHETQEPSIENRNPDFNYTGYDFFIDKIPSPSIFPTDERWESAVFDAAVPAAVRLAEKYNLKWIGVFESGNPVGKTLDPNFGGNYPIRETDEQHQKWAYEKYFELMSKFPKLVDVFKIQVDPWPNEGSWNPFGRPAEDVLKANYAEKYGTLPLVESDKLWIAIGEDGLKAIQVCISNEIPFDGDYVNYPGEYKKYAAKIKQICR